MSERIVVLIPASLEDEQSVYWKNFVWSIQDSFRRGKVKARVVVGSAQQDSSASEG